MKLIYDPVFMQHDTGMHPENKKRLISLGDLPTSDIPFDESIIELVHSSAYIDHVKEYAKHGRPLDNDTVTSPMSYEAAVYAANATIMAAKTNDFAIVRPPGHHAYPHHSSGFCLFNNVAIAAQNLVEQGKKVLIFDFDGHLGDGTSEIFYHTDTVMYWSIHQFPAFPGHGNVDEIGKGDGKGYTINVPLPAGSGDDIFMDAFNTLLPIAEQFQPDVVAISAGFDAHQYDLLLDLRLTVDLYYELGKILKSKFPNMFATLEGGYNVEELPKCLYNFLDGVNGSMQRFGERHTDSDIKVWDDYEIRLNKLLGILKDYWTI